MQGTYDFEARWFGVYEVKSAVAVAAGTTVTWQTYAATEFMRSSSGSGLSGQDSAMWVRPAGSSGWYFSGYPNGAGQVAQELLPSSYDFQARWFGVYQVQSAVAVSANSTVTFQTYAATEFMRSSTGAGLSGQDSAIWVRPAGSSGWYFSGYPNGSGQVAQELLASSYDFQARWFGVYGVKSAVPILSNTTVTWQTYAGDGVHAVVDGFGVVGSGQCDVGAAGGLVGLVLLGVSERFGSGRAGVVAVELRLRGAVVRGVRGAVGGRDLRRLDGDVPDVRGDGVHAVVDRCGVVGSGQCDLGAAGGLVGLVLLGVSERCRVRSCRSCWRRRMTSRRGGSVCTGEVGGADPFEHDGDVADAMPATEFMRSSTGSGLSGQDSAIWVRPAGSSGWYFSGYPNSSGQVAQELLPSSYDFQARWFGVYQVQSAVAISANSTVTFQGEAVTLSLLSSTGSGLSGQDSAIWVRPAGTSGWYFSGYPNSSGQVAQQLLDGSYDVQFRWLGAYQVSSANAVSGATTIAVNAAALNITARKTSDNSVVSGAATYVNTGGGYFFIGYTDGSGQSAAQVLVGTVSVQCTKSPLTGTNSNLAVGAGGTSTTVMLA